MGNRTTTEPFPRTSTTSVGMSVAAPGTARAATDGLPPPATPMWTGAPLAPQASRPVNDYTAARPAQSPQPVATMQPGPMPPPLPGNPPASRAMPPGSAQQPFVLASMPVVVTPPRNKDSAVPVGGTTSDAARETVVQASMTDGLPLPRRPVMAVPPTPVVKSSVAPEKKPSLGKAGAPLFRMVNTKRITLNFEVKDVGPSGLSGVELWFTQDAKEWKKYDAPRKAQAYVVEVDEEGMYGFTLVARSGTGLGQEPPQPGDQPQVWVVVDLTPPKVALNEIKPAIDTADQTVAIRWKASDKNLGRRPISLYYAEKEGGPWRVMATGLENNGAYKWQLPKGVPSQVLVRVEATDLAGNVGRAQSPQALLMDRARPRIINVEATAAP